jgi:hypothetical protein
MAPSATDVGGLARMHNAAIRELIEEEDRKFLEYMKDIQDET